MKKFRKINPLILIAGIIAVLFLGWIFYSQGTQQSSTIQYLSKDLKISLSYPKGWFIQEKDFNILLASYETRIGQNSRPNTNQIKIFIDNFSGCHPTIEENLKDPACGEGGPEIKPNEIISKEMKETSDATFYKYVVKSPSGNQFTFYLLENGDRVIQISKEPDPSQYEKEFEEIINSIKFQ